jgi:hypothetical protein
MIEIIVGFIVLVVLSRLFPERKNSPDSQIALLPFLEDRWLDGISPQNENYYDFDEGWGDDFNSLYEGHFDDSGDNDFE